MIGILHFADSMPDTGVFIRFNPVSARFEVFKDGNKHFSKDTIAEAFAFAQVLDKPDKPVEEGLAAAHALVIKQLTQAKTEIYELRVRVNTLEKKNAELTAKKPEMGTSEPIFASSREGQQARTIARLRERLRTIHLALEGFTKITESGQKSADSPTVTGFAGDSD